MKNQLHTTKKQQNNLGNESAPETKLIIMSDEERFVQDILRPDNEKFKLFVTMLRRNAMLKKAVIKHRD